jgi:hypothetical protein
MMLRRCAFWIVLLLTACQPDEIPAEEVARAHRRYHEEYGQSQ